MDIETVESSQGQNLEPLIIPQSPSTRKKTFVIKWLTVLVLVLLIAVGGFGLFKYISLRHKPQAVNVIIGKNIPSKPIVPTILEKKGILSDSKINFDKIATATNLSVQDLPVQVKSLMLENAQNVSIKNLIYEQNQKGFLITYLISRSIRDIQNTMRLGMSKYWAPYSGEYVDNAGYIDILNYQDLQNYKVGEAVGNINLAELSSYGRIEFSQSTKNITEIKVQIQLK